MVSLTGGVLCVGLDGADPRLLARWNDVLPNLRQLMENGVSGKLSSVIPPISASAWTSFGTGLYQGKTGVFDFVQRAPGAYRLNVVRSTDVPCKTFWEILSTNGYSVGVMNVPVISWPPQKVPKGFVVSGLPDPRITAYPPGLADKIKQGGWMLDPALVGRTSSQIRDALITTMERRAEVAKQLIKEYAPDFFMIVFTETDRAQHFLLSRQDDLVEEIYRKADQLVGDLIGSFQPRMTAILSDHGCEVIKATFLTNVWLAEKGFLTLKNPVATRFAFEDAPIDWERTRAFSYGEQGKIHINLAGREPRGVVELDQYPALLEELERELSGVEYNGKRLAVRTWRREQLYSGPYLPRAPDLVFQIENGAYGPKTSLGSRTFFEPPSMWSSDHATEGIYIITGGSFKKGKYDASIVDVAPTLLREFGVEAPGLDGRAIR